MRQKRVPGFVGPVFAALRRGKPVGQMRSRPWSCGLGKTHRLIRHKNYQQSLFAALSCPFGGMTVIPVPTFGRANDAIQSLYSKLTCIFFFGGIYLTRSRGVPFYREMFFVRPWKFQKFTKKIVQRKNIFSERSGLL